MRKFFQRKRPQAIAPLGRSSTAPPLATGFGTSHDMNHDDNTDGYNASGGEYNEGRRPRLPPNMTVPYDDLAGLGSYRHVERERASPGPAAVAAELAAPHDQLPPPLSGRNRRLSRLIRAMTVASLKEAAVPSAAGSDRNGRSGTERRGVDHEPNLPSSSSSSCTRPLRSHQQRAVVHETTGRSPSIPVRVKDHITSLRRYVVVRILMWALALLLVWGALVPTSYFLFRRQWDEASVYRRMVYNGSQVLPSHGRSGGSDAGKNSQRVAASTVVSSRHWVVPATQDPRRSVKVTRADSRSTQTTTIPPPPPAVAHPFAGIVACIYVQSFDVVNQQLHLTLEPRVTVNANLTDAQGLLLQPIIADYYYETMTLNASAPLRPVKLTIPVSSGTTAFYPFDRYRIKLSLRYTLPPRTVISNPNDTDTATPVAPADPIRIPTMLQFPSNQMAGYVFEVLPDAATTDTSSTPAVSDRTSPPGPELLARTADLALHVHRQSSVIWLALMVTLIMYILTVPLLALTVRSCWMYRENLPSANVVVISGSILLTLPMLRSLQPYVPPGICFIDFWGFLWNLVVALVCTITLLCTYHARYHPQAEMISALAGQQSATPSFVRRLGLAKFPTNVSDSFRQL
ncbi:hypothetical protein IWQ60_005270 [Tieghemiomyces parasiticus]|uniref:Transmembrane protein n=1 Tax=Tieghemiomyces parasiticus TaxID=78921 RepID=A0A9W8A9Z1_9FUNG|nr:hypothetical protein IWQ60_005270 [Tieghemiomyces parasiticus]